MGLPLGSVPFIFDSFLHFLQTNAFFMSVGAGEAIGPALGGVLLQVMPVHQVINCSSREDDDADSAACHSAFARWNMCCLGMGILSL